jgi:hypothetical protein
MAPKAKAIACKRPASVCKKPAAAMAKANAGKKANRELESDEVAKSEATAEAEDDDENELEGEGSGNEQHCSACGQQRPERGIVECKACCSKN